MPANLIELLEAPVPILVGLPTIPGFQTSVYRDIIWVHLDKPSKKTHLSCENRSILSTLKEPHADNLKGKLTAQVKNLGRYRNIWQVDSQCTEVISAFQVINGFWRFLADLIPLRPSLTAGEAFLNTEELRKAMLSQVSKGDSQFVSEFVGTQVFLSYVEGKMSGKSWR